LEITLTLALEPKLLLLDEPSCGLTSGESAEITALLRNLGRDITILLVAHDMDLVFGVADRIMVLHYGKIIVEGMPEKIRVDSRVREIYIGCADNGGTVTTG
jgi:ABC-type branched-subunit amino acid transport system ATPase component